MNNTLYIDNFVFWTENDTEKIPDVPFIPPMLRRRMSVLEKIAISLANSVVPSGNEYEVVFASRFGEWEQTIKLIEQFYTDKEMSPAGFSNSVHNASMGHLSLLTHNTKSYTSIAGGAETIENGLLHALTGTKPVLFVYAEERNPEQYYHALDKNIKSQGCAILISDKGQNKYEMLSNNEKLHTLSFESLKDCLENKADVKTSNWKLLKK